jgi:hypothetical protein
VLIALTVKPETTEALDWIAQRLPMGARSTVSRELVALGKLLPRSRKLPKLRRTLLNASACIF